MAKVRNIKDTYSLAPAGISAAYNISLGAPFCTDLGIIKCLIIFNRNYIVYEGGEGIPNTFFMNE